MSVVEMLAFNVSSHVHLSLECPRTHLAGEGFEAGVFATVCDQIGRLAEGFATVVADVWFFSC